MKARSNNTTVEAENKHKIFSHICNMKSTIKPLPANPFENADADKVWKELLRKSKPLSREDAMRRMKEAAEAQKKK